MNRRAVILNGSNEIGSVLDMTYEIVINELEGSGWTVNPVVLRDTVIAGCRGCFRCWVKTPGVCVLDDSGRDVARMVISSDLTVFLTPVTFGGYSSELKKAVDRLIPLISPYFMKIDGEVHHRPRYRRYPRIIAFGGLPHQDSEVQRLFETVVRRNAINMHCPAHNVGFVYDGQGSREIRDQFKEVLAKVGVTV